MLTLTLILSLIVGAVAWYWIKCKNKPKLGKTPPGPWGLPFIGSALQMDKTFPFLTFNKWAEEYGDICAVTMAGMKIIVVSDPKMVKELFSQDSAFAGRATPGGITDLYTNGTMHGVINTDGEHWEQLRRFTLRQMRDLGFGKCTMEALIMDELAQVLEWMKGKADAGEAVGEIKKKMSVAVVNSLWTIVSGQRYRHDDPKIVKLTSTMANLFEEFATSGSLIFVIPWLKYIIPEWSGYNKFRRAVGQFRTMFSEAVEEHKQSYSDDYQRDFIDVFLKEIKSCQDTTSAFFGDLGERQLIAVINDLFQAGSDTTSITLDWTFLYLSSFPEVQKKLQAEIDDIVGNSRHVSLSDRPNMPYTEAVLHEVLRYSSITPQGVPHRVLADRVYRGYAFPAGTAIMANFYGIHHSTKIFKDPANFRPERFLTPDGKFKKHEALMPFSTGRRQCAGETLARDSLFLYTTNIFQRFTIEFDPRDEAANPGTVPRPGFILFAKPYKVIFKDRLI